MISLVIVDDEELFRSGLTELLDAAPDIEVVGQAADGRAGIEAVQAHRPDVVLLDMQMPRMDGLTAAAEIRRSVPSTAIVVLTSFDYDKFILPALRLGAAGYLLKDSSAHDLRHGIRAAAAGEAMLSPAVTRHLLDAVGGRLTEDRTESDRLIASLSERERDVLGCVAAGMTNPQIARHLYSAETTIKTHLAHALAKLGDVNRTQAAIIAHEAGLAPPTT